MAPDRIARALAIVLLIGPAAGAMAASEATVETPLRDPWVPAEVAKRAAAQARIPSTGTELRAQVDRKLRERFEAAAGAQGTLTRDAARAAGLGFIDRHFDAIDRRHVGRVSYEDYREFLRSRGAALD